MSYLLDFVKTLTTDEMKKFVHLDVIGKEELVRDVYAHHAQSKNFDETKQAWKLNLTQTHFDKINSILLDKCILALYGSNTSLALSSILHKGLTSLVLHEIKILEKKTLAQKDATVTTTFYLGAFEALRGIFHPNYSSILTHQFGKKYLLSLGDNCTITEEAYIAMMTLYADIVAACYGGNEEGFKPEAERILKKWEKKITHSEQTEAGLYILFAKATYYKHMSDDIVEFQQTNEKALALLKNGKWQLSDRYLGVIMCELGLGYIFSQQYDKALESYNTAFELFPDTIGKNMYHIGHYFTAILINGKYEKANQVFELYIQPKILPATNPSLLFDIYMLAGWSYILQNKLSEAFEYLNKLRTYRKNSITLLGQVMVRHMESTFFYLNGDKLTASAILSKNTRYIKKVVNQSFYFRYYLSYLDVLTQLIKMEQGKLQPTQKIEMQIKSLTGGIYHHYNSILMERYNELLNTQA